MLTAGKLNTYYLEQLKKQMWRNCQRGFSMVIFVDLKILYLDVNIVAKLNFEKFTSGTVSKVND